MKVVLYMAVSLDGFIARLNGETPWSDEEWGSFSEKVKECGNLVMGRKTFEIMIENKEFDNLGNPFVIVVSKKGIKIDQITSVSSPEEALSKLKERGFKTALLAGGSKLNSSFLKKELIDEMILDVEPTIFGNGITLFDENNQEIKLKLFTTKKISENTIQLHYEILK